MIVVVGSANQDILVRVERFPTPGETLIGTDSQLLPGGKGANQAVAAARLGARVALIAKVGRDPFGDRLIEGWRGEGIETTWVQRDQTAPTGIAVVLIGPAENEIVVAPGANGRLTPVDVDTALSAITEARVLIAQLEVPLPTVVHALRLAKQHGVTTLLNPAPAHDLPAEVFRLVDIMTPNASEAAHLVGQPVASIAEACTAGAELCRRGVGSAIVTLGRQGAVVVQADRHEHIAGIPIDAIDPTGAGDAFNGALAVFLAEGRPMHEAARLATVAAALSTTRVGAQAGLPTRQDVLVRARQRGWG